MRQQSLSGGGLIHIPLHLPQIHDLEGGDHYLEESLAYNRDGPPGRVHNADFTKFQSRYPHHQLLSDRLGCPLALLQSVHNTVNASGAVDRQSPSDNIDRGCLGSVRLPLDHLQLVLTEYL